MNSDVLSCTRPFIMHNLIVRQSTVFTRQYVLTKMSVAGRQCIFWLKSECSENRSNIVAKKSLVKAKF